MPDQVYAHELVVAQAQRTPDALAVVWDEQQVSYSELNRQANQLAHYLHTLGVGIEVPVGVCLERSGAMIVALLAIFKAGGAYVPLDPAYPPERLEYMLNDAQTTVLLTQETTQERLLSSAQKAGVQLVCLDTDAARIKQEQQDEVASNVAPANLAYIIYTSGSTGAPKGVMITHEALVSLIFWHKQAFNVSPSERVTQLAGPGFDASVWEIWPNLASGASIHIPDDETRLAPEQLRDWLVAQRITLTFLPTPLAEIALSLDWPQNLALHTLLTGGDKLHHHPAPSTPFKVVNNYGPTESTVVSTSCLVPPVDNTDTSPPIGQPLPHTQVYVLDRHLQPVPMGVVGELYIGGAGLARGYLHRPDLTAERFLPHPFGTQEGQRLYRTGDLVRLREDGALEYVGREDQQVKVRGFRIELGEIETVLGQHPAVREAVVLARSLAGEGSNPRLVAYVVSQQEAAPTVSELRGYLRERLPEYMVPAAVVLLSAWPLTPNGKVDRQRLPEPEMSRSDLPDAYVAPRTSLEEQLVQIWSSVLRVDRIGVYDNFFDLGGNSLLATQVRSRVRDTCHAEFPLLSIFKSPTVSGLAKEVVKSGNRGNEIRIQPMMRINREYIEQLQSRLEKLSDEEIDSLLRKELSEK